MRFMVIERYKAGRAKAIYARFRERGRMLPAGLVYLNSWVEPNWQRCFQLMQAEQPTLLEQWAKHWEDLIDFEFVAVLPSREAAELVWDQTVKAASPKRS